MNNSLQPENLYRCSSHYLFLYPTREKATEALDVAALAQRPAVAAVGVSAFWSKRLNCEVGYLELNEIFFVLEVAFDYIQILRTSNGKVGWIILKKGLYLQEISK